ncbi:MAG: DUF402 domain-containing protein [Bacilli bacterium]|jgi:protein associated with RNAse G/E
MSDIKKWIFIQSYKHDGSLHRHWQKNLLLDVNENFIVVASKKTKVVEGNGRFWFSREPAVSFFHRHEWWNAIAMIKKEGISFYINIASPSLLNEVGVRYIDYDVDIKLFPSGETRLLDEREFSQHAQRFDYGDDIEKIIHFTTDLIMQKIKEGCFPFNENTVREYYNDFLEKTGF